MTFISTLSRVAIRLGLGAGLLLSAALASAQAQTEKFPDRAVTLILPFPPGSTSDTITRILQSEMTKRLDVPVVVENKSGASGEIAYSTVARAKPDGHTLLLTPDAVVLGPLIKNKGIDEVLGKRFTPVTIVAEAPLTFIIPRVLPVNTVKEFVAYAKSQPQKLNFGSSGVGSVPYLSAAYFMQRTGIDMVHIPYRGAAHSMNAMFANEIQFFLGDVNRYLENKDRLKALVVTGSKRDPRLPDVPTFAEAGYPGEGFGLWLGLFAPAGTSPQLVARLNSELSAIMTSAEFQAQMRANGYESNVRSPSETDRFVRNSFNFWKKVVVEGKLRFEP